MILRPETEADIPAIDQINLEAFLHHPYSHQTEHLIVRALRASGALTLSLVAETEGQVVGHIAFSPALIDGQDLGWYTLGPVAVLPSHQRKGIGSSLIQAGLQGLRELGAKGCLLVGDPNYYLRFGFRHDPSLHIHEVPPEFFMCMSFSNDTPSGLVTHHQAFFTTA
jgi:putative acetyltransferase